MSLPSITSFTSSVVSIPTPAYLFTFPSTYMLPYSEGKDKPQSISEDSDDNIYVYDRIAKTRITYVLQWINLSLSKVQELETWLSTHAKGQENLFGWYDVNIVLHVVRYTQNSFAYNRLDSGLYSISITLREEI